MSPRALEQGERDGQVPRRLGDPLLADGALVAPLLELRDDRGEQLDDDRARDVGHHAEPEDREPRQRAAAEQVQEPERVLAPGLGGEELDPRRS